MKQVCYTQIKREMSGIPGSIAQDFFEIFRVLGKHRPEFVSPYLEKLWQISETDENRVVRIHCLGAIKAAELAKFRSEVIVNNSEREELT